MASLLLSLMAGVHGGAELFISLWLGSKGAGEAVGLTLPLKILSQ